jgi:hypothetical protein
MRPASATGARRDRHPAWPSEHDPGQLDLRSTFPVWIRLQKIRQSRQRRFPAKPGAACIMGAQL